MTRRDLLASTSALVPWVAQPKDFLDPFWRKVMFGNDARALQFDGLIPRGPARMDTGDFLDACIGDGYSGGFGDSWLGLTAHGVDQITRSYLDEDGRLVVEVVQPGEFYRQRYGLAGIGHGGPTYRTP